MSVVVSDTTCITHLISVGQLELLQQVFGSITIPSAVNNELRHVHVNRTILDSTDWIRVLSPRNRILVQQLLLSIDLGESEAIALSLELNASRLIIDEQRGRTAAVQLGQAVTGTLGVILLAKKQGHLKAIRPIIVDLLSSGFRLSRALVNKVLLATGEVKL